MKILFYLPVITPWWFEKIAGPMIRNLSAQAEVHVIVAPVWRNTGLLTEHVEPFSDLPINWHIVAPDDPAEFRFDGASVEGLLDLVNAIAPDITLARSTDEHTPRRFPGIVRYIMEPSASPFIPPDGWFVLEEALFQYGVIPEEAMPIVTQGTAIMAPAWQGLQQRYEEQPVSDLRAELGLPLDRPILAVPLQYEHEENLFGIGSPFQYGPELVEELLASLDERIFLAVTDHPLNEKHLIRLGLDRIAARNANRMKVFKAHDEYGTRTRHVVRVSDAVLLDRTKCVSLAAFFGTPILHIGDSLMAPWLNANAPTHEAIGRLLQRDLPAPDREAARHWFGWHYGSRLLNPEEITLERLIDQIAYRKDSEDISALFDFHKPRFDWAFDGSELVHWEQRLAS